jgi:hypothetical protein
VQSQDDLHKDSTKFSVGDSYWTMISLLVVFLLLNLWFNLISTSRDVNIRLTSSPSGIVNGSASNLRIQTNLLKDKQIHPMLHFGRFVKKLIRSANSKVVKEDLSKKVSHAIAAGGRMQWDLSFVQTFLRNRLLPKESAKFCSKLALFSFVGKAHVFVPWLLLFLVPVTFPVL